MDMQSNLKLRRACNICRICLKKYEPLIPMHSGFINDENYVPIHEALGIVINSYINRFDEIDAICENCLKQLTDAYKLITQWDKTEEIFLDYFKLTESNEELYFEDFLEKKLIEDPPVELITNHGNFSLQDLIIVEEDNNKTDTFECFLNDINENNREVSDTNEDNEESQESNAAEENQIVDSFEKQNKKLYLCQKCGLTCTKQFDLNKHLFLKHNEKKFICNLCGKTYCTNTTLKKHLEVHENKRQHLCTVCGKDFNYSSGLEYHMRLHSDEKRYQCNFCGKSFRMVCALKRHIRTHTGARPYKCRYCDKAFRSSGELQCHEWTHTGFRPYRCQQCNKGFTKTYNLNLHMLGHEGPYNCEICERGFLEIKYVKLHMKISHKIKNE